MEIRVSETIEAPLLKVFAVFTDLPGSVGRIAAVTQVELLVPGPMRRGTRWKETRLLFGKSATETLEVTEFEPEKHYVIEATSCGTHYRTAVRFREVAREKTVVEMQMTARPLSLVARLASPFTVLMQGSITKALAGDLRDLKIYLEGGDRTERLPVD